MNTFNLNLDLDKTSGIIQWVTLRQGDKNGTQLRATIYDHGTPVTGNYTARFSLRHPGTGDTYYRETATYNNGVATVTVDEQYAATVTGITAGYFELLQGSTVIASTADFGVRILASATDGAVPGEVYDSAIEDALAELDEATGHINQMVVDATEEYLNAHPELTTTVEDNSLTDAKLIQQGGILSRVDRLMYQLDNLLINTPAEAESVTVGDAAKTPVAGLALYGKSTQDGTPTPSAPVAIQSVGAQLFDNTKYTGRTSAGVTWTVTADGFHASGTASGGASYLSGNPSGLSDQRLVHVGAGTYTVSNLDGGTFTVTAYDSSFSSSTLVNWSNAASVTFTVSGEMWLFVNLRVVSGSTVDKLFRIMVFEWQTSASGFVPSGHVGLWARGRNLLPKGPDASNNGITYTVDSDGVVTANGTNTAASIFNVARNITLPAGTYKLSSNKSVASGTPHLYCKTVGGTYYREYQGPFTLDEPTTFDFFALQLPVGTYSNRKFYLQLELGSTATAYQPYVESVTPIPLDGHTLRSLPDGTRDEVTVDELGHAVLTVRTTACTVKSVGTPNRSGSTHYASLTPTDASALTAWASVAEFQEDYGRVVGNIASFCSKCGHEAGSVYVGRAWNGLYAYAPASLNYDFTQLVGAEFVAFNKRQTIDLGTIDPVPLVGPDLTAQAVPTAPFALTYERDLNVTLARLEAAIADAATA